MAECFHGTALARRGCTIQETDGGEWIARERRGGIERRFPSRKAALHFALFERGERAATALLTPPRTERALRHGQ
jgi:hypothetical protein